MTRRVARRAADGFTLLEMLVALVVFGLLLAGLSQTTHFALSAWRADTAHAAAPARLSAVNNALRNLIGKAVPTGFAGNEDEITFTTALPAGSGVPGLADVAILLAPGQRLVLRFLPHPAGVPLTTAPPVPRIEPLLDGVEAVRISYLAPKPGGAPEWLPAWQRSGMPLLVRISLRFAGGGDWPDLVAAPTATGP